MLKIWNWRPWSVRSHEIAKLLCVYVSTSRPRSPLPADFCSWCIYMCISRHPRRVIQLASVGQWQELTWTIEDSMDDALCIWFESKHERWCIVKVNLSSSGAKCKYMQNPVQSTIKKNAYWGCKRSLTKILSLIEVVGIFKIYLQPLYRACLHPRFLCKIQILKATSNNYHPLAITLSMMCDN